MILIDPTGMYDEDPNVRDIFSITVTAAPILVDLTLAEGLKKLKKFGQKFADGMERAYEFASNVEIPFGKDICKGLATAGSGAGFAIAGAQYGATASLASGGTLAVPMSAGGLIVGGTIGYGFGNVYCNSGGGGGGGGGQSESGQESTGRTAPKDLKEKLAMEQVMSNPTDGIELNLKKGMTDPRWPAASGWVKMSKVVNGVEIHWLRNKKTGLFADFKFIGK
jgi:hypothetical protein